MGDCGDLLELNRTLAPSQCALIGLNPLHALRPAIPLISVLTVLRAGSF